MIVTLRVRIFGGLQRFVGGQSELYLNICEGTTVWDLVKLLGLPENEVWFVSVCGARVPNGYVLHGDEQTDIFAPVGGG